MISTSTPSMSVSYKEKSVDHHRYFLLQGAYNLGNDKIYPTYRKNTNKN